VRQAGRRAQLELAELRVTGRVKPPKRRGDENESHRRSLKGRGNYVLPAGESISVAGAEDDEDLSLGPRADDATLSQSVAQPDQQLRAVMYGQS
jgi:hypothetical protein